MSNIKNSFSNLETHSISKFVGMLGKSAGNLKISFNTKPVLSISLGSNKIQLDVQDPSIFENITLNEVDGGSGFGDLLEKLKAAQQLAETLNNSGVTLIVSRKGKEAFTMGRDATPTVSSVLTGSDDIHIDSITQTGKLGKDLSKGSKTK